MKQLKLNFKVIYRANPKLEKTLMAQTYTPLSRMGAYARKVAMNSLKSRKGKRKNGRRPKPSTAGTPPHSLYFEEAEKSHRIKKHIAFEKFSMTSIVVGPRLLTPRKTETLTPELHEKGGSTRIKVVSYKTDRLRRHTKGTGKATKAQAEAYRRKLEDGSIQRSETAGLVVETRSVHYPQRPYMKPAVVQTFASLPKFFKNYAKMG